MNNFNLLKNYKTFKKAFGKLSEDKVTLCTDTRNYSNQSAFLAISGDNYNAFQFISSPIEHGCKNIIFSENSINISLLEKYLEQYPDVTFILVDDSIRFLQEHAKNISMRFQAQGNKLICISGSNGKTTTKEMLAYILEGLGLNIIKTQKNNNNHIGVPLTLLQISDKTEYAIVELGSNHPGEIETLCDIAQPNIGVVTNIGFTHMEFFPELDDVFKEEAFLFHHIANKNVKQKIFFQNLNDDYIKTLPNLASSVSFGPKFSDYQLNAESISGQIIFKGDAYEVNNSNITGKHNFFNLCVSIAITHKVTGLDIEKICEVAQDFKPTANRSQWLDLNGTKIFLDAYNANPSSMEVAINAFEDFLEKNNVKHKEACVILGDMNELGEKCAAHHEGLGKLVGQKKFGSTIFVGRYANYYTSGLQDTREVKKFDTTANLIELFRSKLICDYKYIFIKGSRSLQLEALVDIT